MGEQNRDQADEPQTMDGHSDRRERIVGWLLAGLIIGCIAVVYLPLLDYSPKTAPPRDVKRFELLAQPSLQAVASRVLVAILACFALSITVLELLERWRIRTRSPQPARDVTVSRKSAPRRADDAANRGAWGGCVIGFAVTGIAMTVWLVWDALTGFDTYYHDAAESARGFLCLMFLAPMIFAALGVVLRATTASVDGLVRRNAR